MQTEADIRAKLKSDPSYFNDKVLNRPRYWSRQTEICESILKYRNTYVATGNAVGKSYLAAGLLLWFVTTKPGSLVLATAPTQTQLEQVLWKEVERAYRNAKPPGIGGRCLKQPLSIDFGGGWKALGYSTQTTERFSGHHAKDVFVIVDEASGVEDAIYDAISSLNPSRQLFIGNPLRPSGKFFDLCTHPNELSNIITISSLESPDIELERGRGLADATWLAQSKADYGEGSLWWTCHVLGRFPDSGQDSVFPISWLRACEDDATRRRLNGPRRMAIDLAEGLGGDRSVIMVADHDNLLERWYSRTASLEKTAEVVNLLATKWDVAAPDISFDVAGLGTDFGHRLQNVGLIGARPYRGGLGVSTPKYFNLRAYAAWHARQRLDPARKDQNPFHIPKEYLREMWDEMAGLRYEHGNKGEIKLEVAEDFALRLRHSPDLQACFCQLFMDGTHNTPQAHPQAQTPAWQWPTSRRAPGDW